MVELLDVILEIPADGRNIVRKLAELVHEIDKQILFRELSRIGRDEAKLKPLASQTEFPGPLVVVHKSDIVDLGKTEAQISEVVVRRDEKVVGLKESANELVVPSS